jgi:hypothetical protein
MEYSENGEEREKEERRTPSESASGKGRRKRKSQFRQKEGRELFRREKDARHCIASQAEE